MQTENVLPPHYLPIVVRLCGKLEMLDRILPKLKAANHRVRNSLSLSFRVLRAGHMAWASAAWAALEGPGLETK